MAEYRYWRITKISTRLTPNSWVSADYVNFNNNKNIAMLAENLTVSDTAWDDGDSKPIHILSQDNSYWTSRNNSNKDVSITYDFKEPVEVTSVSLRMRQNMQPTWGQEWQEAIIQCSQNNTNWIFYGIISPKIGQMDLTLKTVPIDTGPKVETNLELPVGDYWWNMIANSNPIFALDSTSKIEFEGSVLRYANNPNSYFISEYFVKNAIEKSDCYGIKTANYTQLFDYFYSYKSLKFKKIRFNFKEVLNYPENFTLILYAKVYSNSCFLGKNSTGADHGPVWERVPVNSQTYVYNWRYDNEVTGQNYSYTKREEVSNPHISYVVYTGSLGTGKVKAYTPYGLYNLTTSRHFKSDVNIDLLGYNSDSWNIDADIIAFGVFDKEFTTEEISSVLSKIETDFKIDQKVMSTSNTNQLLANNSTKEMVTTSEKIKMNLYNFYKPVIQKSNNMLLEKIYTKNLKISKYHNISDYILEEGQPIVSKIFLIERLTGQLIATTISNQSGYFEFKDIDKNLEYMVISPHKQYQFKSVIKDYTK